MFHWYGLFIGIAVVVGWTVAERIEPRVNKVAPWVLGLGFVGARLYHIVDIWGYYAQHVDQTLMVWNGGMSIWGGLIGGGVGYLISNRKFSNSLPAVPTAQQLQAGQIERMSILGAIVTALPLAQAIGRLGNAVNGEFINKVWILPWWAAEAILDLMLFVLLRGSTSKYRVWVYLVGYGLIRLVLQPYR